MATLYLKEAPPWSGHGNHSRLSGEVIGWAEQGSVLIFQCTMFAHPLRLSIPAHNILAVEEEPDGRPTGD
jgi:hypothetical protein